MDLLGKTQISILGMVHEISTYKEHSKEDPSMGTSDCKMGTVKLCEGMPPDIAEQTLLHEIIHLIDRNLAIGLKENQVISLAAGLYSVIKENNL
jgi:hypothetical protein